MDTSLTFTVPGGKHLPDNDQWTNRFEVRSASSSRLYIVSQNIKGGHWACSCPGWKTHRVCKHIKSIQKVSPQVRTLAPLLGPAQSRLSSGSGKSPLEGYKTYEGTRGSEADWQKAFSYRMGLDEARKVVGKDSPRAILGVTATAAFEVIKAAWRDLVKLHHPDHGGNPAIFRLIQGAFEILEDKWIRAGRPSGSF